MPGESRIAANSDGAGLVFAHVEGHARPSDERNHPARICAAVFLATSICEDLQHMDGRIEGT